jgi:hypothetical protein
MKSNIHRFLRSAYFATTFVTMSASGATFQWNGATSNDWATDANWTGTAPDDANVSGSHRLNVNGATTLIYSADSACWPSFAAAAATREMRPQIF